MIEMSAGRSVVELLKAEGVRHVFGIVGSTFLDVPDIVLVGGGVLLLSLRR